MFVGNSIARHVIKPDIGWHWDYGMVAPAEDKDNAHIVMREFNKNHDASYCICQASKWEMSYKNAYEVLPMYEPARDFEAGIIVMRIIENVQRDNFCGKTLMDEYKKLMKYLDKNGMARFIITGTIWERTGEDELKTIAEENGVPFVPISDIAENQES